MKRHQDQRKKHFGDIACSKGSVPGCTPSACNTRKQIEKTQGHVFGLSDGRENVPTLLGGSPWQWHILPLECILVTTIGFYWNVKLDAPRVVFIHGTPGYAGDFDSQLLNVPDGWNYVSVDRPGFGLSEPKRAFISLETQVKALAPVLETDRPVILVGFSLGGPVVVRAALDRPDKVKGIVLASGNLDPALEKLHWYNYLPASYFLKTLLRPDWRVSNNELLDHRPELLEMAGRLDEIAMPVAFVHAKDDTLVPIANVDFAKAEMTSATIAGEFIVERGQHMIPIRDPGLTLRAVLSVIDALELDRGTPATEIAE